ncbi:hypothetical protein [Sphingobacterium sp. 1.A.5]|jgi:hypothetical protein|uniref:hypothetical protein n=1 Tax=Sphingobacterium sp. 1.A.5 TaxID=2044604 RepID=UPI000C0BDD44|nr:hypothetical protein [Sphingobacterium sp. 1.A.5]
MKNLTDEEVARLAVPTLNRLTDNINVNRFSFLFNYQKYNWKITALLIESEWEIIKVERRMNS